MIHKAIRHIETVTKIAALICLGLASTMLSGQNSYEALHSPNAATIERSMILNGRPLNMHSAIYPYRRGDIADIATYLLTQPKSEIQQDRLERVLLDNNEFLTAEVREYWKDESMVDSLSYDVQTKELILYDSTGDAFVSKFICQQTHISQGILPYSGSFLRAR